MDDGLTQPIRDTPPDATRFDRVVVLGSTDLAPGSRIASYTVGSLIGHGGMGAVYHATQASPSRSVALKLLRPGLTSDKALRRFELEAQVLGRLAHPGIASIYEAGIHINEHTQRVPYFAMEYVEGPTLCEYALHNDPTINDRLALFAKICDAVHHAHTKGVIHRDLKPGNILIATVDGEPVPKVLDFGVARTTDADRAGSTMQTEAGQIIGTVPYMSPEQIGGDPDDIDTRSDVYALGVVLYEFLSGMLPYPIERKQIAEAARMIQNDDPVRLSSINTRLRGDIATIVAKALEKSPDRRYQSAADLGADIRRSLSDEPIEARAPSTLYQIRKFSKRNKALVSGAAAAGLALLIGLAGTSAGFVRAERERARVQAANETLRAQNEQARDAIEELLGVLGTFDRYELAPGETSVAFFESDDGVAEYFNLVGAGDGSILIEPLRRAGGNAETFSSALPQLAVEMTRNAIEQHRSAIDELRAAIERLRDRTGDPALRGELDSILERLDTQSDRTDRGDQQSP